MVFLGSVARFADEHVAADPDFRVVVEGSRVDVFGLTDGEAEFSVHDRGDFVEPGRARGILGDYPGRHRHPALLVTMQNSICLRLFFLVQEMLERARRALGLCSHAGDKSNDGLRLR
jgi:hypothetical protein